jgi:hypothetical protein
MVLGGEHDERSTVTEKTKALIYTAPIACAGEVAARPAADLCDWSRPAFCTLRRTVSRISLRSSSVVTLARPSSSISIANRAFFALRIDRIDRCRRLGEGEHSVVRKGLVSLELRSA